jgi:hypothetical protein
MLGKMMLHAFWRMDYGNGRDAGKMLHIQRCHVEVVCACSGGNERIGKSDAIEICCDNVKNAGLLPYCVCYHALLRLLSCIRENVYRPALFSLLPLSMNRLSAVGVVIRNILFVSLACGALPAQAQVWERVDSPSLRVAAITSTADGQMFCPATNGTYRPCHLRTHPALDAGFTGQYAATADGYLFGYNRTFLQYQYPLPSAWQTLSVAGPANTVLYTGSAALPLLPVVRGQSVTVFSRDTTLRNFVPTRVVRVIDNGVSVVSSAVRGLPETLGFSRVVASSTGTLFITDDVFKRSSIYRSADFGVSWQVLPPVGRYAQELTVLPATGTVLIGGGGAQPFARSTDDGQTWVRVQGLPIRPVGTGITSFLPVFIPRTPQPIQPVSSARQNAVIVNIRRLGMYRSVDDGTSFTRIGAGLSGADGQAFDVFKIAAAPNDSLYALVADVRGRGVYRSGNGGVSWSRINTGLPLTLSSSTPSVDDTFAPLTIAFDSASTAYLGTTRGVYRLLSTVTNIQEQPSPAEQTRPDAEPMAETLVLPNPAHEQAAVRFRLRASAVVRVELWSLLGEQVAQYGEEQQPAGAHEYVFDVRALPIGLYRCCVQVDGRTHAVPLVVMR